MQTETARNSANDNYKEFTGTDYYYDHGFGFKTTDGAQQLAEDYGANWFIDLIISHQTSAKVRAEGFQVWKLTRIDGTHFKAVCEDGNDNVVVTQDIEYSDFKDDSVTMWCVDRVILLPSEY
jgi:hypothetical protein